MPVKKPKEPTPFLDPSKFRDEKHGWLYHFPIANGFHPDYGRMEVDLEPVYKRGKIACLLIQFRQQEDPLLTRGMWSVPTPQADKRTGITSYRMSDGLASFFEGVWQVGRCIEHGNMLFSSYVPDGVRSLEIECLTTSINIHYRTGGPNA